MDARLNGFCTDFPTQEKEPELNIPYFLTPEWQAKERRKAEQRAARESAKRAVERQNRRRKQQATRDIWRGAFASMAVFAFVVFAVNIAEVIL